LTIPNPRVLEELTIACVSEYQLAVVFTFYRILELSIDSRENGEESRTFSSSLTTDTRSSNGLKQN